MTQTLYCFLCDWELSRQVSSYLKCILRFEKEKRRRRKKYEQTVIFLASEVNTEIKGNFTVEFMFRFLRLGDWGKGGINLGRKEKNIAFSFSYNSNSM